MRQKNQANLYFILNVSPQSSDREIKKAYLKLVQTYHPDKNRGNKLAEKKFRQINEAWQVLKDPKKRKLFDESLKKAREKQKSANISQSSFTHPAPPIRREEKPINLEFPLKVSLEDLCQSRSKNINYFKPVNGTKVKSSFAVQIPLGAWQGTRLRFKSKGGAEGNFFFGDLYIRIQIESHEIFQLEKGSKNLIVKYPISFISAIKNQKLEIPSPYGFLTIDLASPLRDKQLLKIKGHGLPLNLKGDKGDLFVQVFIEYPLKDSVRIKKQMEKMSVDQKKFYLEKFRDTSFIYPKVLKFQKKIQELKRKWL